MKKASILSHIVICTLAAIIVMLSFSAVTAGASSNDNSWLFSDSGFSSLGTIRSNATVDGLTMYASTRKTMSIATGSANVGGVSYTKYLNTSGSGSTSARAVSFTASGSTTLSLIAKSASKSAVTVTVKNASGATLATLSAGSTAAELSATFNYNGVVYVYGNKSLYIWRLSASANTASTTSTTTTTTTAAGASGELLSNGGFETGSTSSWTVSSGSEAISIQSDANSGNYKLSMWNSSSYTADVNQTVSSLSAGTYTLTAYVWNDGGSGDCRMYAYTNGDSSSIINASITAAHSAWTKLSLSVPLSSSGSITVGFYKVGSANGWMAVDDVSLTQTSAATTTTTTTTAPTPPAIVYNPSFTNAGFESGNLNGWTLGADDTGAAIVSSNAAYAGNYKLYAYSASAYTVDLRQYVSGLTAGYYKLTCYARNSGSQNSAYIYGNGTSQSKRMTSIPVTNALNTISGTKNGWILVTVRNIYVGSDGRVTLGFYSDANAKNYVYLDSFALTRESEQVERPYLVGGDFSELTYVEDQGAAFYNANGSSGDAINILADAGHNFARLRLYNNPGKGRGDGTYYCKDGYQNLSDILSLATRAKNAGMAIELTLHYSDFWSNGATQIIPADWQSQLSGNTAQKAAQLENLVYTYTKSVMQAMVANGTVPEYVSLGNEIQDGMLFGVYGSTPASNMYGYVWGNYGWNYLADFFNAGYRAVKEVCPSSQVILHLTMNNTGCTITGSWNAYDYFCSNAQSNGVNYDIIGSSYYPFWTDISVNDAFEALDAVAETYGKKVIIMETGYNFSDTLPNGSAGQLSDNGVYQGVYSGESGQRDFMIELINAMKCSDNIIGDLYWDPIFVEQNGVGWAMFESTDTPDVNVVSNTTLFDFNHTLNDVWRAYKFNN